jgi:hypothetical protein
MIKELDKWHKTRAGLLVFAIIEAAIFYGFSSLAIDRGNFLWYILALIFLVGTLQNLFKLIGTFIHGRRKTS